MSNSAQLLAVEAKLAKEPDNNELLELKEQLIELIELSGEIAKDEKSSELQKEEKKAQIPVKEQPQAATDQATASDKDIKAKKDRKKKEKLREKVKVQSDIAEKEKASWRSFASKKGLKGVTKKSIFASPCSVTGKVGVGTNGIADLPGRN